MAEDFLFKHALAVAGWPLKPVGWLTRKLLYRKGARVTVVSWDGCMATVRNERGTGTITRICNQRDLNPDSDSIPIVIVRMDDGTEERFPEQWVRIVNRERLEVWC